MWNDTTSLNDSSFKNIIVKYACVQLEKDLQILNFCNYVYS